jgi:hypothetical protein
MEWLLPMKEATKVYSNRHEKMVQDLLGWKTVSASGARPFHPGDVKSDEWLGECKTHTTVIDKITIDKDVWRKISNEAMSCLKKPVLFVDNGTQSKQGTWAVVDEKFIDKDILSHVSITYRDSKTRITFSHLDMYDIIRYKEYGNILIDGNTLVLMRLATFKEMLETD